jgi:AAA domain/Lon protease (S16) C-terminal proteolytic domain
MTPGWRVWGRRGSTSELASGKDGLVASQPRAAAAIEDLWRPAGWGALTDQERAALLEPYAGLAQPATDVQEQGWLADLVARHLQPAAVSAVRTWLADAAPSTHLYAVGSPGRGRTSVVATLARRAMAMRPAPPEYCYLPDPTALGHTVLLELPAGTGVSFADALSAAMRQVLSAWEKPRERARIAADDMDDDVARMHLISQTLEPVATKGPEDARRYVERLIAALHADSTSALVPNVADVDAPAGRTIPHLAEASSTGSPGPGERTGNEEGAPVVLGSLARMDLIRSLLRANGGILILPATDFVDRDQPNSDWATLRAMLRAGALPIHGASEPSVPLSVRIALIGTYAPYRTLERAEDFVRLFRYKARFEDDADWTPEAEASYAALVAGVAERYQLPTFDPAAVARLVEEGARRAPRHQRFHLTTDMLTMRDLGVEAGRAALTAPGQADGEARDVLVSTTARDVEAVLATRRLQHGAAAREARDAILADRDIVPTSGSAVGAITGLGVALAHPFEARYAVPFRISATVSPGRERLIDIEREADSADSSHISGTLTMAGYLAWRYRRARPISVVARMRFEQEHEYTSGPSASAAELFALLSALAEVPIRCALAVTGAVGQHGEMQLIGSTNEKIEGFWEICRARRAGGETPEGAYGVLIPAANAGDLMLQPAMAESIAREGWFHIWPIRQMDDGLPLLTGVSAASFHVRVDRQLRRFYHLARQSETAE